MKVLLADHQPLTCAGLQQVLRRTAGIALIEEIAISKRLAELLQTHKPDLLIADYCFNDAFTLEDLVAVASLSPQTGVLVISDDDDKDNILQLIQSGIPGYLTKSCSADEIMQALNAVASGKKYFCTRILNIILEKQLLHEPDATQTAAITARETEILKLLASGYSTQKIADHLFLSPHTVHTHRKSIIRKLNIKSPTEFVIHAMDLGLIDPKLKGK